MDIIQGLGKGVEREREREEAGHEHVGREEGGEREERRTSIKLQGEGEQAAPFIVSPAHLAVAR